MENKIGIINPKDRPSKKIKNNKNINPIKLNNVILINNKIKKCPIIF
jgi:hypothetical protein